MATDEKNHPHPPYVEPRVEPSAPPLPPGAQIGYEGQPSLQYPSADSYYPAPGGIIAGQSPPPAYDQQQQVSNVMVVGGAPIVPQNLVVVQTVRPNVQIPVVYPGVAFCKFAPGTIETIIRASVLVR